MALSEEAKAIRNAKAREWYSKNKERQKAANERYWERLAAKENSKNTECKKSNSSFEREVMFWIARMCLSNKSKRYDKSLYPVSTFISHVVFCGFSEQYARKIYNYILDNNNYEFEDGSVAQCYVSGDKRNDWKDDYFVIPVFEFTEEEFATFANKWCKYV
jgi:hypothetical protein